MQPNTTIFTQKKEDNERYAFIINGHVKERVYFMNVSYDVVGEKDGVDVWPSLYMPANAVERFSEGTCYIAGL